MPTQRWKHVPVQLAELALHLVLHHQVLGAGRDVQEAVDALARHGEIAVASSGLRSASRRSATALIEGRITG